MTTFIERLAACFAATAGTFYAVVAILTWHRILTTKTIKSTLKDRAAAWTALAILFICMALFEHMWLDRDGILFDITIAATSLVVFIAGMVSFYAMTVTSLGLWALVLIGIVSILFGSIFLVLS